ncbi:MAG: phosphatase PAP2 family protein [Prevotella sp.]|nr:phosphatase PAP2 family protein [Prevotella sp.]
MTNDSLFNTVKELDSSILSAINFNGPDAYSLFWSLYTQRLTWLPLALVASYYLLRRGGWRNALLLCVSLIIMFLLSDFIVASLIKPMIARLRPSHDPSIMDALSYYQGYRGGMFGFPSNHASNGFAAATLLTLLFRQRAICITAFLWAVGSCYSRLYLGVHFPTDILAGALLGCVFALLVYLFYKKSYLYLRNYCPMPEFNSIYKGREPWGIAVVFGLTVAVLAVVALV